MQNPGFLKRKQKMIIKLKLEKKGGHAISWHESRFQ